MPSFTERKAQLEAARAERERRVEEERACCEQQRAEEERRKTEEAERRRKVEEARKGTDEPEVVMGDPAACWNCRSRGAECVRQR